MNFNFQIDFKCNSKFSLATHEFVNNGLIIMELVVENVGNSNVKLSILSKHTLLFIQQSHNICSVVVYLV